MVFGNSPLLLVTRYRLQAAAFSMYNSFLKSLYRDIKTFTLDTLFPIYCIACEREQEGSKFICDDCVGKLTPLSHQFCVVCHKMSIGGLTHPKCQTPHSPDGLISILDYQDEKVADILIKGKYSFLPKLYDELGALMARHLTENYPAWLHATRYTLTAVPLHWMRQNWRGFNQAQILAQALAKELNLPCCEVLSRKKFTKTQKNLKKDERVKNVDSAFSLSPKILSPKSYILNQDVILIDDVTTTGSTLKEAVKVLKRNGAAKVYCLTVARD